MLIGGDEARLSSDLSGRLTLRRTETIDPYAYIPWAPPYLSQLLGRGLEECNRATPDVLVGWYFEPYGVAASLLGQILGKPVVLRHAGSDLGRLSKHPDLRPLYRHGLSRAARIMSVGSEKATELLIDAGASDDRIVKARGRAPDAEFANSDTLNFDEFVDKPNNGSLATAWNRNC